MTTLTGKQIADEQLTGWTYLLGGLQTRIRTGNFATALELVAKIGAAAGERGADLDIRQGHVDIRLTDQGVTEREISLARTISTIVENAGVAQGSAPVSRLELALDTPDRTTVQPFWAAVMAMETGDGEITDPAGSLPAVWFQESGTEEPRQRWHPDVWVDPAQVQPRIDAAIAAGGTLVSDAEAPSFWVLADPEGNQVCLCTWQQRA